jgi:hypothetical protein
VLVAVGEMHPTNVEAAERELKLAAARVGTVLADHNAVVQRAETAWARSTRGSMRRRA